MQLIRFDSAPTEIIELENTLLGTIFPQDEIIRISEYAHSIGVKMHLDGARIWHVAVETGMTLQELCDPFDSVSVCFSKGLGTSFAAPSSRALLLIYTMQRCPYRVMSSR
jgi:threonine aldolase